MALLLVNERGVPQAPADVAGRLRGIDPHLGLRCYQWGVTRQWAVIWTWEATDPRMARVQSGEIDPATAVDIMGYLPLDATPEDAVGIVGRMLKSMESSGGYAYVTDLLAKVRNHNHAVKEGVWQPTMDRANEAIEVKAPNLFGSMKGRIAKSKGFGPGTKPKRTNTRPGDPA